MSLTWAECERLFIEADARTSKPDKDKFKGWKQSQTDAYIQWRQGSLRSMLLFFPTGEGKSKTALAIMACQGLKQLTVICPLRTHKAWVADGDLLGVAIQPITPQMFRTKGFKPKRGMSFIYDEFHQAGGRSGDGWKKINRMAAQIPYLIMCSATPNYNDAERVFCATAIGDLDPLRNYASWLNEHCNTVPSRYSFYPDVDKENPFKKFAGALEFLRAKPWVAYVEDTATWSPYELVLRAPSLYELTVVGYSRRQHRLVASQMEERHKLVDEKLIDENGFIRKDHMDAIVQFLDNVPDQPRWLIFCNHKTVAEALYRTASPGWMGIVTGDTTDYETVKQEFIQCETGWLIGTTTLATGIDGIDKACHAMLILDPIDGDPSLTRQLIGRILPRGADDDAERVVVTAVFK
jgi:superfamily II DNA or RNA helicase